MTHLYRLAAFLPFSVLYAIAWFAYLLLYYVVRYRRQVVRDNLRQAFPEKNSAELKHLAQHFYRQLCQVAVEILKARRMTKQHFQQRVSLVNPELLKHYSNNFQAPFIILTIHQGNWEWMLHATATALKIPLDPVYKPLHNDSVDRLIVEIRSRFGAQPIPLKQSAREILRHRRRFRALVMVADQAPTRHERSLWADFMNRPAPFHPGAETVARLAEFPLIFAQCKRRRRGYYEIEFHALAKPPFDDLHGSITERYIALAQKAIYDEPQSWLWSNRRWKRQPDEERGEDLSRRA